ncbi:MAG: deoxynucleoside kinase [Acidithiobacillus sp.]|uniref:deoxynucleoside kinase n=1 Tax=Acidithiobacillus sp. TaxID=1872118 RepID=UPI003D04C296
MTTAGLIVVEGPMGAGKTSLARLLSTAMNIPALLERPADNPFLGDFYRHQQHVLATELQFLLQRRQIFDHLEGGRLYIADHGPEKDRIFTPLTLEAETLRLFREIRAALSYNPPPVLLLIYLDHPVDLLLERIRARRDPWETEIQRAYLLRVQEAYRQWLQHYPGPILDLSGLEGDFVADGEHAKILTEMVKNRISELGGDW